MSNIHDELPIHHNEPIIAFLNKLIKVAIKLLAILMVLVIFWGVGDVLYVMYHNLVADPFMLLNLTDIFKTFAAFLAVLIAIEIYQNIVLYLSSNVIPLKLVLATALMAIARKVIIIDFKELIPMHIFSIAAVVLALGVAYYLVGLQHKEDLKEEIHAK